MYLTYICFTMNLTIVHFTVLISDWPFIIQKKKKKSKLSANQRKQKLFIKCVRTEIFSQVKDWGNVESDLQFCGSKGEKLLKW